jgi:hypothetical protein
MGMDRGTVIDEALERHRFGAHLRTRIERLLEGVEDRRRLTCCNSGCFVCVEDLKIVLREVETVLRATL